MNRRKTTPGAVVPSRRAESDCALLFDAGESLRSASSAENAAARVASVLVPRMGDWCFVDAVLEEHVVRLATMHEDVTRVEVARRIGEKFPLDPEARFGPVVAIRSQRADLVEDIPLLVRQALPEACGLSRVVAQLGIHSRVVMPLTGLDGTVLGALTVAWAETRARYTNDDLPVLSEIAWQTGLVLEAFRLRAALASTPGTEAQRRLASLSRRERQVLELVAAGLSTREIAAKLVLGHRTVETHRVHVLRKLRLKGAVDVVRFAARCGLIADPDSIR